MARSKPPKPLRGLNTGMTQRLLVGRYPDGTDGMKLSVPGTSVLTADAQHLIFDSAWAGMASVHQSGTTTVGSTISFPALSYIPMVNASAYSGSTVLNPFWSANNPDTTRWSGSYDSRVSGGTPFVVTTSTLTFVSPPSGFTGTYTTVRYLIYRIAT